MSGIRPLRVVLATTGTRGDVQPMLGLAQALVARGHTPVVAAPPNFGAWVKALGFEFAPLGADMQVYMAEHGGLMSDNPRTVLETQRAYIREEVPLQAQQLAPVCRGADAIVYSYLVMAAPSVAEHARLPILGLFYTTCMLPASAHPPTLIPWQGLPGWLNRIFWSFNKLMGTLLLRKTLNAMRSGLALPPVTDVREHLFYSRPIMIAADETLFPPDRSWQGRFAYANFITFDDPGSLDPELEAWLDDGDPPVFIGFGSMSGKGIGRIGQMIVEAVSTTGRRCVVGAGWGGLGIGAGGLPAGWRVVADVPHALLFPRCSVVVHHGGSGTMAQALRAGVPQVILPGLIDQFHHAYRLHLAGLCPHPVPMKKITAAGLRQAIQAALALPAGLRMEASARLQASDGRGDVVRRVDALCGPLASDAGR